MVRRHDSAEFGTGTGQNLQIAVLGKVKPDAEIGLAVGDSELNLLARVEQRQIGLTLGLAIRNAFTVPGNRFEASPLIIAMVISPRRSPLSSSILVRARVTSFRVCLTWPTRAS
jgi:hypothetical protein